MEVNMKKGKSRHKRKKSRLLWIAIAVIGIAAVISAICVAGMLATKENAWRTPEELLVEYMDHILKQEYEEMYAMLHIGASGNVSQEDLEKHAGEGYAANSVIGRSGMEGEPMYNRFRQVWCPGSTFKPITAAVGLESGAIDPMEDYGNVGLS